MLARFGTAAVALPALAMVVWVGGAAFMVVVAIAASVGAWEVRRMAGGAPAHAVVAALLAFGLTLAPWAFWSLGWRADAALLTLGPAAGLAALALITWPAGVRRLRGLGFTVGAAAYPAALLAHALPLRDGVQGLEWVALLLAATFATDTAAFFVGRAVGRRPLAPSVSPRKTWEGAAAGFACGAVVTVVGARALGLDVGLPAIAALGALMGAVGQAGDLFASKLKRLAGAQESSRALPGHGGLLDRLDSIVFNLPLVYYAVQWGIQ